MRPFLEDIAEDNIEAAPSPSAITMPTGYAGGSKKQVVLTSDAEFPIGFDTFVRTAKRLLNPFLFNFQ